MPIQIVRNDITRMKVDAIVNAANETLLGGGGVDGAIHKAAGPGLLEESRRLGGCPCGEAKITKGYMLYAKYVIHTVGPVWRGGNAGEDEKLYACYAKSLMLAKETGISSIAFPMISTGAYRFPVERAARIQRRAMEEFLKDNDMDIYIVVFDKANYHFSAAHMGRVASFISEKYAGSVLKKQARERRNELNGLFDEENTPFEKEDEKRQEHKALFIMTEPSEACGEPRALFSKDKKNSLERRLELLDESFSQTVLRLIDEKGMTDVMCYKRANMDRKLFSKLRSDVHYRPSKKTALALAVALELSLKETAQLLSKAGLTLSHSFQFDIIVEYFIQEGIYDIFTINEALFYYDQPLLGA